MPRDFKPKPRSLGQIAVFVLFALLVFPQLPLVPHTGLDTAWMAGLNMAHAQHLLFGRDMAFTYGPLSYLSVPLFPEAEPNLVRAYTFGIYGLLLLAASQVVRSEKLFQSIAALLTCGAGIVFLDSSSFNRNIFRLEAVGLLAAVAFLSTGRRWTPLMLLAFASGLAALVKFSSSIELILLTLCCLIYAPRRIAVLLIIPATTVLLFFLSQGTLAYLGTYFKCALELISGYPQAMAWSGSLKQQLAVGVALALIFVAAPLMSGEWRTLIKCLLPAAIVAFFAYKNFITRQDSDHMPIVFFQLALAAVMAMSATRAIRSTLLFAILSIALTACGAIMAVRVFKPNPRDLAASVTGIPSRLISYADFQNSAQRLSAEFQANIQSERLPESILRRIGDASVDVIPHNILAVKASGVAWNPRPVFQSYSAYTPYLDRMNGEHFRINGAERPIISLQSIDDRIPFVDEPLVWRALLDNYDFEYQTTEMVLLRRRNQPKFGRETAEGETTASWGQTIDLPPSRPGEFIVMRAKIPQSLAGSLTKLAFRPSVVNAKMTFASGLVLEGRVIPANMEDGWIISPFPPDEARLAPLFDCESNSAASAVRYIRFETEEPWQFKSEIYVQWSRLRCSGR
jgi:hypothetical protein